MDVLPPDRGMLHGVRNPGGVSCLRSPPGSFCFRGVCCVFLFGFANSQNPISATHCPCQLQTARRAGPASARKRPHGAAQGERRGLPFASPVQVVVGAYMRGVFDDLFEKKAHFFRQSPDPMLIPLRKAVCNNAPEAFQYSQSHRTSHKH